VEALGGRRPFQHRPAHARLPHAANDPYGVNGKQAAGAMRMPDDTLAQHWRQVAGEMLAGRVVPFLGAGANLCGRPGKLSWRGNQSAWLPSGRELSYYLARRFTYQGKNRDDLVRVSQYVALTLGSLPLYDELRQLFDRDYPPTSLHQLLAQIPGILSGRPDRARPYQLIVTTNYDDALEQAFDRAGEAYDVVWYEGPRRGSPAPGGRCMHRTPDGEVHEVVRANEYGAISLERRPVILKVHGAVDRHEASSQNDSYVISEDHYIEYLSDTRLTDLFPVTLLETLFTCHFLFLGYRLRDWNVRVILHQIWREREHELDAWAIQRDVEEIDRVLWDKRGVHLLDIPLDDYVEGLAQHLPLPAQPATPGAAA
jgi:SIR2-like protein